MRCFTLGEELVEGIELRRYESDLFIQAGELPAAQGIPLAKTWRDAMEQALAKAGRPDDLPLVKSATLPKNGPLVLQVMQDQRPDRLALVHVSLGAGEGGELVYTQSGYTERLDEMDVVRKHHFPFIQGGRPPAGISVVAIGIGAGGEPEALLVMKRKSSFRLVRSGDVGEAALAFSVYWDGYAMSYKPLYFGRPLPKEKPKFEKKKKFWKNKKKDRAA